MQQAQRTQIYLPKDLRADIDYLSRISGESMAEYIRKAARQRVEKEKKRKAELKKIAEKVTAGVFKSGWEKIDVLRWQREIRKDRKII